MPVGNSSPVAKPGSRLRELGLVLPEVPTPLGAYLQKLTTQLKLQDFTLVGFSMGGGEIARYFGK